MSEAKSDLDILKNANSFFRAGDLLRAKSLYSQLIDCEGIHQKIVAGNLELINSRLKNIKKNGAASDHALVIHVWHLDVLDELAEAAENLPDTTDQFVTLPAEFGTPERDRIASVFPRAQQVVVEDVGQDVGALFQLMKQVDLGRYAFICKIHTKKGPNMPNEWRRALLDGVLGSKRQVQHIIERFRADPQVMMAGARQLYVNGPAYLEPNAQGIETIFPDLVENFDFKTEDWGFIAGTCFWIRTLILQKIAACPLNFKPAAYVTDGAPAHAVERMFGLLVAVLGGRVLLQDLRFAGRLPDDEAGFPTDLPLKRLRLAQILTPLAVNMFLRPYHSQVKPSAPTMRNRVAVFASYSDDGILPPQVIPYLEGLKPLTSAIVVVFDNDLLDGEKEKLKSIATHVITGRHGEYDFGSYKRGYLYARKAGLLENADDLILCNDSCFGPIGSFSPMFAEMEAKGLDFWGATDSHEFNYHLQSYFAVLTRNVFQSKEFSDFIDGIAKQKNVQEVILNYELGLTKKLQEAGFQAGALVSNILAGAHERDPSYNNLTLFPLYTLTRGLPLVKVKALRSPSTNADGINRLLGWLQKNNSSTYTCATSDIAIGKFSDAKEIGFSIVMPTFNREWCIEKAIKSALAQTHEKYELLIIDDGSEDGTSTRIHRSFSHEILTGKIRYIRLDANVGVCNARNIGVASAKYNWVAYADSDNVMRPYFLTMMANSIIEHPERDSHYARIVNINSGGTIGQPFNRDRLLEANFIDLGAFIHRRELFSKFGSFDPSLKRLVDWDLIIRFTKHKQPNYISRVVLEYTDDQISDRISSRESFLKASTILFAKHSKKPTITTVILSYNHKEFIADCIESALAQKGDFHHEIILSDDASKDGTSEIIKRYAEKYPKIIRDISSSSNAGISANYLRCFSEAGGNFIAVLEGDDYWTDPEKNLKQANFLVDNLEAKIVFSRVNLLDTKKNKLVEFPRQNGLPSLLNGLHIIRDEYLNPIANLSSTMFRKDVATSIPNIVFSPRINEISLCFYLDRIGKIGFIDSVMGVYRLNPGSVWTGASEEKRLIESIVIRENALRIARPIYRATIQQHIDQRRKSLASVQARRSSPTVAS